MEMAEHFKQRLYLHENIYPKYINLWLEDIKRDLTCLFVEVDVQKLAIVARLKKTEFKKNYKLITEGTLYNALEHSFYGFLQEIYQKYPDEATEELKDIYENSQFKLLISIVMIRNGDIHIRL